MGDEVVRDILRAELLRGLSISKGIRLSKEIVQHNGGDLSRWDGDNMVSRAHIYLSKEVAHQLIVVADNFSLEEHALLAPDNADEVARHDTTLMDQLVE